MDNKQRNTKFCKDCKYYTLTSGFDKYVCAKTKKDMIDLVNNIQNLHDIKRCEIERTEKGNCGIEGKHWEAI